MDPDDLLLRGDRRLVQVEIWIGAFHPRLDLRLLPPSPVHVDFLCPLGRLGEDDDPRREHLRESPGDREVALHAPLPVLQLADGQRRQQRRVARQDPQVSQPARQHDLVHCFRQHPPLGRDDLEREFLWKHQAAAFIFSALSTTSSIRPTI